MNKPIHGLRAIAESVNYEDVVKKANLRRPSPPVDRDRSGRRRAKKDVACGKKFHALCAQILKESNACIVLTGTQREQPIVAALMEGLDDQRIRWAEGLNLFELTRLICLATAFVGNDSGGGHVAGLLGTPTVSLHVQPKDGDATYVHMAEKCRPVGPNITLLQPNTCLPPCKGYCASESLHCLDQIGVEEVWEAIKPMLFGSPAYVAPRERPNLQVEQRTYQTVRP